VQFFQKEYNWSGTKQKNNKVPEVIEERKDERFEVAGPELVGSGGGPEKARR